MSRVAITKFDFERMGPSPEAAWCAFWKLADEEDAHFLWRGGVDEEGRDTFISNTGASVLAREVAWAYWGRQLEAGKSLVPTCRRKHCIHPNHQVAA